MDMFLPVRFKTSVHLAPVELTADLEDTILKKLRKNLEGICTRHGYIKPSSLEIVRRSIGQFIKQHFNGHLRYDVVCRAEVCNPPQHAIIEAVVKKMNELGIHAESSLRMGDADIPVLDIIIPKRAAGIQSEIDLSELQIGDRINVEVLGKRFQLNDRMISIIGRATKTKKQSAMDDVQGAVDDEDGDQRDDDNYFDEQDDDISESGSQKSDEDDDGQDESDVEEQAGGSQRVIEIEDDGLDEEKEEEDEFEFEDMDEERSDIEEAEISDVEDYE